MKYIDPLGLCKIYVENKEPIISVLKYPLMEPRIKEGGNSAEIDKIARTSELVPKGQTL